MFCSRMCSRSWSSNIFERCCLLLSRMSIIRSPMHELAQVALALAPLALAAALHELAPTRTSGSALWPAEGAGLCGAVRRLEAK